MSSSSYNHVASSKEIERSLWCFFCYKESRKYLCSLDHDGGTLNANGLGKVSFLPYVRQCEDCALVLRDFCDFYEEIKCLEMKMNWKLNTLKAIMTSAERVPIRVNRIQSVLKEMEQEINVFAKMKRARKNFVSEVSAKMKSSLPRVKLKRCNNANAVFSSTSPNKQVSIPSSGILKSHEKDLLKKNISSTPIADASEPFLYEVKQPMEVEDAESQIDEVNNADGPLESVGDLSADFSISKHDAAEGSPNFSLPVISHQLIETADQSQNMKENKEPCKCRVFRNRKDQMRHSKLHGNFKCNFCKTSRRYAPHISEHEINAHKRLKARGLKSGSNVCPRCDFQGDNPNHLLRHHLKSHLKLVLHENHTCPICDLKLNRNTSVQNEFVRHYLTFHDLTKMDVKLAKRCDVPMCKAYFRTSYQLLMHKMRVHYLDKKKKYGCEDCKNRFRTRKSLMDHRSKWHLTKENFSVSCTFKDCNKLFECEEDMLRHLKIFHEGGNVTCPDCGKVMPKCKLPLHQVRGHTRGDEWLENVKLAPGSRKMYGIYPTRCDVSESCQKQFYNDKDFSVHSKLHGEFKCSQAQCDQVFQNAKNLALHELVHDNTASPSSSAFPCPRCMFSTKDEVNFLSHFLETHLKLSLDYHSCPICNFKFSYKAPCALDCVRRHFKIQHDLNKLGTGETVYNCEEEGCSAYFVSKLQIVAHRNTHKYVIKSKDNAKPYECFVCQKRFKTKPCVILHHKLHEDTTLPFRCPSDACAKRFGTKEALDSHLSESPVVMCEQCAKSFHEYSGLSAHSRVHKNGKAKKTFVCETCGKKFKDKERLHLHNLTHLGKGSWEFICSVCGRKMISKGKLKEHMKTHAKDRTYFICEICGAKYNQRHNLRIHVNSKHGDITWDAPNKYDKTNLTLRKGIKLKSTSENPRKTPVRRNTRRKSIPPHPVNPTMSEK